MRTTVVLAEEKIRRDAVIRNATTKRRIDKRKVAGCGLGLLSIIVGIVLLVCNITRTLPAAQWGESAITDALIFFIAYGLLFGLLSILMGVCAIIEASGIDLDRPKKRRTR